MKPVTVSKRDLFEQLEPPVGGRQALRERLQLEGQRRRRIATRVAGFTVVTAAAAVVLVWFAMAGDASNPAVAPVGSRVSVIDSQRHAHPALAVLDGALPAEPVSVRGDKQHRYAVQRIASNNRRVVFYMVSSRAHPIEPAIEPEAR